MVGAERRLIVNADDFGQSAGVNRGIIQAHEHGIVTSAGLMVRWPAAAEAALYSCGHPALSLGLHFDLGEWVFHDSTWTTVYEVVPTDDITAVAHEVSHQLTVFRQLVGRNPTHLDSHQHVHRTEPIRSLLAMIAHALGIPLRHYAPRVRYCGDFYGQTGKGEPFPDAISVDALITTLMDLPPGITELACHPGLGNDLDSAYCGERSEEVKTLCDPRVRARLGNEGIKLFSFHDVASVE